MARLQEGRDKAAEKWKDKLCQKIIKIIDKHIERVQYCIPVKCDDTNYQVACYDGTQFNVNLQNKNCTCRKWELSRILCKHAIAAIYDQDISISNYWDKWIRGMGCYIIHTSFTSKIWGEVLEDPKKTRRREPDELPKSKIAKKTFRMGKRQNNVKCGKCGIRGHSVKGCKMADVKVTDDAVI
ncbi:hypothetical protein ACS0TY_033611 [Phlomoides rotata]